MTGMQSVSTETKLETTPSESSTPEHGTVVDILTGDEPKLYAGKYKSDDELEKAYNSSATVIRDEREKARTLESKYKVPDEYEIPPELSMRDGEINEIKNIAKKAGLSQLQFVETAKEMQARVKHEIDSMESAKAGIGQEKLNVVNDYVERFYPESLRSTVLNKIIKDGNAMNDAMKHRDSILNSAAPGMSQGSTGATESRYDGQSELVKAANQYAKSKSPADKERYIKLAAEVGNERYK